MSSAPIIPPSMGDTGGGGNIQEIPDLPPMGSRRRSHGSLSSSTASAAAQWSEADKSGRSILCRFLARLIRPFD